MTEPIKPKDLKISSTSMPSEVIEAFNELVAKYWDGKEARFRQKEVIDLIIEKTGENRQAIFDNHWLDIEPLYKQAGWNVYYDAPGFNERPYEPIFTFSG